MRAYEHTKIAGRTVDVHRLVWEQANGPIPDGYVVHHINHDKRDNRLENLQLMTHEAHSSHHNNKHPRIKTCEACGAEYEPAPTKRARSKSCSWACRNELIRQSRLTRKAPAAAAGRDVPRLPSTRKAYP